MAPFQKTSPAPTSRAFSEYVPRIVVMAAIPRFEATGSSGLELRWSTHSSSGATHVAVAEWLKAFAVKKVFPIQLLESPFSDRALQSS